MQYYGNYPAPQFTPPPQFVIPRDYLTLPEKERIRKNYSKTALTILAFECVIYFFALMLELLISVFSGEVFNYNSDGQIIFTSAVEICGSYSVIIANLCVSVCYFLRSDRSFKGLFGRSEITFPKMAASVLIGLGMANLAYFCYIGADSIFEAMGVEAEMVDVTDPTDTSAFVLSLISTVILAPVFEEIFYRGIVMTNLCRVSKRFAIIVSALIFGLAHGNIYQFMLGFLVGMVFAYIDIRMKSIIPSMIVHAVINGHTYLYDLMPDTENAETIQLIMMFAFTAVGAAVLAALIFKNKIKIPEYTEYHKKRTLPVMICSIPCWITAVVYVFGILSDFHSVS